MKKIISLILTMAMVLSLATFVAPVSAETEANDLFFAEQTREEFLNAPAAEYLELPYTNDAFATVDELFHYLPVDNAATNFPSKLPDGSSITNNWNSTTYKKKTLAGNVFLIDTMLGNTDGKYSGKYLKSDLTSVGDSTYTFKTNGNPAFELVSTETDGTMNFMYNFNGTPFKFGPIGGTGAHRSADGLLNAHVLENSVPQYAVKGTIENPKSVEILMTSWTMNGGGSAGLFPVKISYEDGTSIKKYALSVDVQVSNDDHVARTGGASNNKGDGDRLAKVVVYVPKTVDVTSGLNIAQNEKYLSESTSEEIIGKAITLDDVVFPNDDLIIKGDAALIGDFNIARSPSAGGTNGRRYCPLGYVDYINIPVDKNVTSVHMERDVSAALNWKDEKGQPAVVKNSYCAYIPVTIEGASDDYYYFAKLGRLCHSEQAVFAVTITGESLQDKIDALETRIEALDATYNSEQKMEIAEIKNALEALKTEGVLESDFETALIEKLNALYESAEAEIKAAQIASVEGKITAMAFKYNSSMREEVAGIKAEYDALINSGILSSEFNADLMEKFVKVHDVYLMSSELEDKADGWGTEYLVEKYSETVSAKELADGLKENPSAGAEVVAKQIVEKIDKFYLIATTGSEIDGKIDSLDIVYNKEQLETIVEIKADIDAFKEIGGTDKGLAYAEIFNAIYEAAGDDLLQRDIDIVEEKILALPELYSATIDKELAEIEAEIDEIEAKGGVVPTEAAEKLASLVAQRDEDPSYTTFNLDYNQDVFESLTRYQAQFRGPDGNYVKNEAGIFQPQVDEPWTFKAFLYSTSTADEDSFISKLGIDTATNTATVQGVPYQFGKITSSVDGVINEEKNSLTSATGITSVTIDVPNNAYSKLHTSMWANTEGAAISVKYIYADGTTSTEENVKAVAGYRTLSDLYTKNPDYYKIMNNDSKASVLFYRAYVSQYDKGAPGGGYTIAIGDHIFTPDDRKILDKVEIAFGTSDIHIFAMTGQIANSVLLNKVLTESVEKFEETAEANIRSVLEGCSNIMGSLLEKEVAFDSALEAEVEEYNTTFVAIESVKAYTDLDNLSYVIKFTGPVSEASITKALFAVKKNGQAFTDYQLIPVEEGGEIKEVKILIANDLDYESKYELTISREVVGVSGKTILTDTVKAYDAKPAVAAELEIENAAGMVKLTNNMSTAQEVTAIVAVYNESNQMVAKYLVNKNLASGESVSQPVAFDLQEGQHIECLVLDSLTNCRKIFNTFTFE